MTVYTPMPRDEVLASLGAYWPAPPGSVLLRLPADEAMTDGAVSVYPVPGRPGTAWLAIDAVIPPQAAGAPDDALVALIPGSTLDVVGGMDPPPESPPPISFASDS